MRFLSTEDPLGTPFTRQGWLNGPRLPQQRAPPALLGCPSSHLFDYLAMSRLSSAAVLSSHFSQHAITLAQRPTFKHHTFESPPHFTPRCIRLLPRIRVSLWKLD